MVCTDRTVTPPTIVRTVARLRRLPGRPAGVASWNGGFSDPSVSRSWAMGLRSWLRRERRYVVLTGNPCDAPAPEWVPRVASRHRQLLDELPVSSSVWSVEALRACLQAVDNGLQIEQVAIADAWPDGEDALCMVYTPPWSMLDLVGLRRERADAVRTAARPGDAPFTEVGIIAVYEGLDDPASFGDTVANWDMSDPLGKITEFLRRDIHGLGWWGTLGPELPVRPE